jgi:hypothetical protein
LSPGIFQSKTSLKNIVDWQKADLRIDYKKVIYNRQIEDHLNTRSAQESENETILKQKENELQAL